jgi:H+/Cl- antiporter ClcA
MNGSTRDRRWSARLGEHIDEMRIRLARPGALIPLALLGLATGLLAGGVIVLFRLVVEGAQDDLLPGSGPENYEDLDDTLRVVLPLLAALALAVMFRFFARGLHVLGVARIMERLAFHQGRVSWREFFLQFAGAAFAIVGGHSVGREGPHVFLGAASGSMIGQHLALPHNAIRTLVGCGVAAGIAASFNTPLAGVVFALEVVMMEYTVASFTPVILAAVSATVVSNLVFGDTPAFSVPALSMGSLHELWLVLALGVAAGAVSAAFNQLIQTTARISRPVPIWWRVLLAGLFMAGFAVFVPEVMGIGYDSVELALQSELLLSVLLMALAAKLFATALCIGLGVPGGTIGPSLFIGAMLGGLFGQLAAGLSPGFAPDAGFFALLGMGAMMAGSLQAPLAALTAMLELTDNPGIIFPGMLVVVVAALTASEVFGKRSLFVTMLRAGGLDYETSPVFQALRRAGVASVMERRFAQLGPVLSIDAAHEVLARGPVFLLVDDASGERERRTLMPAVALAAHLEELGRDAPGDQQIALADLPAQRWQTGRIDLQSSLQEAWQYFEQQGDKALVIERVTVPGISRSYGVLTRDMVERSYRY